MCYCQKDVYVRVVFIKIGEINTIQETFFADTFVQARWRESKLDGDGEQVSKGSVCVCVCVCGYNKWNGRCLIVTHI